MVSSRFVLNVVVFILVSAGCGKHVVRSAFSDVMTGQLSTRTESARSVEKQLSFTKDQMKKEISVTELAKLKRETDETDSPSSGLTLSLLGKHFESPQSNLQSKILAKLTSMENSLHELISSNSKHFENPQGHLQSKIVAKLASMENSQHEIISSISKLTAQNRNLLDKIQLLTKETTNNGSVQFCTKGLGCKNVWHHSNQHRFRCFRLSVDTASWPDAKHICERMGGYLAEVLDQETLEYVRAIVHYDHTWLGASDLYKEGDWRWAHSGLKVTFNDWSLGQPDDHRRNEDCLHMSTSKGLKWNDYTCSSQLRYLCEKVDDNPCVGWN